MNLTHDREFDMSRDELKTRLKDVVATITFTKKDGTLRQMKGTLKPSYLPLMEENSEKKRKDNPDVLPVWDIEKNEWRSFRINSIKSVSFS